jgi:glycosyltransferase involved in cell wall biosynthesis
MIKQLFTLSPDDQFLWLWILAGVIFIVSFTIQSIFIFGIYNKIPSFKKLNEKSKEDPVSVIICTRNEAENLKRYLPSILNQDYPEFEVIVVNDGSSDETEDVLGEFKTQYPRLYVTGIEGKPGYVSGKKVALTLGVKAAHFEQIVFTNPDSEPLSPFWLKHMQSNFLQRTDIVIGYGGYKSRKGLLNKLIRTDSVYNYMRIISFALKEMPFTGLSRNLAYRKSQFFAKKGFASSLHINSGDEDYFVIKNSNRYNTVVELDRDSHTMSEPYKSWRKWLRSKRIHYSNKKIYSKKPRRFMNLEAMSRCTFFISGAFLLAFWKIPVYITALILFREFSFSIIFKKVLNRFNEKNLLFLSIIYDLTWPFIAGIFSIRNKLSFNRPKWK